MRRDEARSMQEMLLAALGERSARPKKRRVRFFLGTDVYIPHERRVALVPQQVAELIDDLASVGVDAEVTVLAEAGARAEPPFADREYLEAGAAVVTLEDAVDSEPFDLVHCLKEPTDYEARLPGPFLRLGALHLATHPPGVCALLEAKNFSAILDGAVVGNASFRLTGGDRTPIVASMSRFAGAVSGRKVAEGARAAGLEPGKVVVVGGGVAGRSAIREAKPRIANLVVIEPWEPMRRRLREELPALGFEGRFELRESMDDDALEDAIGVVFAHRSGAKAAEKVCDEDQIRRMRKGGVIADIAIDQGGSIRHDGYDEADTAPQARQKYIDLFAGDYLYYGEVNMPREEPHAASIHHGIASLPYVTRLLVLCAETGDSVAAAEHLLAIEPRTYGPDEPFGLELVDAVDQDLRNGITLARGGGETTITHPDVEADPALSEWVRRCAV